MNSGRKRSLAIGTGETCFCSLSSVLGESLGLYLLMDALLALNNRASLLCASLCEMREGLREVPDVH